MARACRRGRVEHLLPAARAARSPCAPLTTCVPPLYPPFPLFLSSGRWQDQQRECVCVCVPRVESSVLSAPRRIILTPTPPPHFHATRPTPPRAWQWDRQPYAWREGADAVLPLTIRSRRNFIINSESNTP